MWCRAMTTPAAPSRCIAISSRAPRLTAFRAGRATRASISALRPSRSPRKSRRRRPASRLPGPGGPARHRRRSQEAAGRLRRDREEVQRPRHLPLLAARRARSRHRAQDRRRSRTSEPRRCLGRQGQGAHGRSGIISAMAGPAPASRPSISAYLMAGAGGRRRRAAVSTDRQKDASQWRQSPQRWSRTCASRPAQA